MRTRVSGLPVRARRQAGPPPGRLEAMRRRFQQWRRNRPGRSRIPHRLWAAAVKAAETYGLCRTARTLGLDYNALKRHVAVSGPACAGTHADRSAVSSPSNGRGGPGASTENRCGGLPRQVVDSGATFIELAPPPGHGGGECILELEDSGGAKMRLYLKGGVVPDLAALSRSFWNVEP